MNYKATSRNNVLTENMNIVADGFTSIRFINIGADVVYINDNIPIAVGSSFSWENHPNVKIDENISVKFANVEINKQLLVYKIYFKEV